MVCLIVDNEPAIRRLIAAVLAPLAAGIVECADGLDAVAAYKAHRPDVVLMDIAMGGLDGLAATRAILAVDPGARVVIVTTFDGRDLRAAAAAAGAIGYVLKENLLPLASIVEGLRAPREDPTAS